MASSIGVYLTDQQIVLAESGSSKHRKIVSSPIIASSIISTEDVPVHADIADDTHVFGTFQKILRDNKIEFTQICVSIPIKDVFLRSFVVPWMPTSELNNVVYYEAKKYVPFDLKLLDYVYQAIPFVENKQKKLRVIFYAVRKQTIDRYNRLFKQGSFKPVVFEPSPVSLAKLLIDKKQLRPDQKTVAIYTYENYGQIIFYEKGISFFVREFSLSLPEGAPPQATPDLLRESLLKEIRKSFGYYNRQFSQEKIKEVLILAETADKELMKAVAEEMSVKVRMIESSVISGLGRSMGMEMMCACGSTVTRVPSNISAFNFLKSQPIPQAGGTASSAASAAMDFSPLLQWDINDLMYTIQVTVACLLILGGGLIFSRLNLQNLEKQNNDLIIRQSEFANKPVEAIDTDTKQISDKRDAYNKILNDRSQVAVMMIYLTKALPKGAWLQNVSFVSTPGITTIRIKGAFSSKFEGEQFKLVNEFLNTLRNDKHLSVLKFNLNSIQKEVINQKEFFSFSITGSSL